MRDKPNEHSRPTTSHREENTRWGTWLRGEPLVVNSCLIFSAVQRALNAPSEKSPPLSLLTTFSLQGAISARYFQKCMAVSSLVRRKTTPVNHNNKNIIMFSFPPSDCTDFGSARSTKHRAADLTARRWVTRLTGFLIPFASEHP